MPYADPERQRMAKRDAARRRRARERAAGATEDPGTLEIRALPLAARIRTAADILGILSEAVADIRADEALPAAEKGRALAYVCGVALRAVEAADLLARVERIEAAMEVRTNVRPA